MKSTLSDSPASLFEEPGGDQPVRSLTKIVGTTPAHLSAMRSRWERFMRAAYHSSLGELPSFLFLALREIEWVVSPNPQADYAHKKEKLQREREHREGEGHKKMGMIPPR